MGGRTFRAEYWPTVLLAVMGLCPAQILFTGLDIMTPTMSQSVGVSEADVLWAVLLGNACLPLGYVFCLDLIQRVNIRRIDYVALLFVAAGSFTCALAPNVEVLVAGRMVQGLSFGVLNLAIIPPLLYGFPSKRLPISIAVLVVGLFGAGTLGPVIGGWIEQNNTWRYLFGALGLIALADIPLARPMPDDPGSNPRAPIDLAALTLAPFGVLSMFVGIGELSWHDWGQWQVDVPVTVGILTIVLLFLVEALQRTPLMTVRYLAWPAPMTGALFSCVATIAFAGLLFLLQAFLQEARGLGAQATGGLLWPTFAGAAIGAVLSGLAFSKRPLVPLLAICGLLLEALTAWQLMYVTRVEGDTTIMLLSGLLGLGAGVSVAPGMFMAALSVPEAFIESTIAIVTLLRESLQALAGRSLGHLVQTQEKIHFSDLDSQQGFQLLFSSSKTLPTNNAELLKQLSLVEGMNDAAAVVLLIILFGIGAAVVINMLGRRRPTAVAAPATAA